MTFASVLERLEKLENPYPGLRPFEPNESHLFFGRDRQVIELLERLDRKHFVAVVGVSGSGKSSLVRAGLIPALERQALPGTTTRWRIAITRPSGAPFENLAAALGSDASVTELRQSSQGLIRFADRLAPNESLLVVVDQFEELFRYKDEGTADGAERLRRDSAADDAAEFVQLLLAGHRHSAPIFIVLTMRSDYLGDCAEFRDLPEALNDCQYLVPRLTREQRKQAIESPLGRAHITPSLVQRMLNDAGDEPDQLPVLQHALMRTWNRWHSAATDRERPIDLDDYLAIGDFDNALNQHADELLSNPKAQVVASWAAKDSNPATLSEVIFKRLTAKGRNNRERRDPAKLTELWALCGAETAEEQARVSAVIDLFRESQASFLAPRFGELAPDSHIDITHESLIRQWRKLGEEWMKLEARSARTFLRLVERSAGEPLTGLDLADALGWDRQRNKTAAWVKHYADESALAAVQEFIKRSQDKERTRAKAQKRTFWIAVTVAVLFAVLASAAALEYWAAQTAATISFARQLAAESELLMSEILDRELPVLLAVESMERSAVVDNDRAMRNATSLLPHQVWLARFAGAVHAVAFSPDGQYVATGSEDHSARVFEAATGKEVSRLTLHGAVYAIAFSPDGQYVATGSEDKTARVFEAATGKEVSRLTLEERVYAIAFSPDGRYVATGSEDKTARVFEAATGKEVSRLTLQNGVDAVTFSPDGRYVATGSEDRTARVFEAATGKEVSRLTLQEGVSAVAFSPDGRYVATGSWDKTARVFEALTGKEVSRLNLQGEVDAVAFSPDGRHVATGSWDKTARVFEASTGNEVSRLTLEEEVYKIAFSPDGRYVATGSRDKTARVFEASTGNEVSRLTLQDGVDAVAFSPDGRYVATGSWDKTARVFEAATGEEVSRLTLQKGVHAVAFSPDGRYAATGGEFQAARVFEAANGKEVSLTLEEGVYAIAFSPDGRYVATGSETNTAAVFEAATGKEVSRLTLQGEVSAVAFSPDGRYVATGSEDKTARVFEVATGKEVSRFTQQEGVYAIAFSPDGRYVATGSWDKTARVFEVATGKEVSRLTLQGGVSAVEFSPDGRYVATGSDDKTARVFEAATGREVSRLTLQGGVSAVAFSPDGRYLATGSDDKTARAFEAATGKEVSHMTLRGAVMAIHFAVDQSSLFTADTALPDVILTRHLLRPQDLIDEACSRVTRNLTHEEWRQYAGSEIPYHKTCPNLP